MDTGLLGVSRTAICQADTNSNAGRRGHLHWSSLRINLSSVSPIVAVSKRVLGSMVSRRISMQCESRAPDAVWDLLCAKCDKRG